MLFWHLCILGVIMGWVESVYPEREGEGSSTAERRVGKIASHPIPADAGSIPAPKPEIPEFLLRPELIPIKEPDDTPLLADAYLRAGGGG